jgi:hypothetical protein
MQRPLDDTFPWDRPLFTDDAFEARLFGEPAEAYSPSGSRHVVIRLPPAVSDASLPPPADAALLRLVRLEQAAAFGSAWHYPHGRSRAETLEFRRQAREAERHGALLRLLGVSLTSSGVRCGCVSSPRSPLAAAAADTRAACGSAQQRVRCAAVRPRPPSSSPEELLLEAARCVERWAESQTSTTECSRRLTLSVEQGSIVMALYDANVQLGSDGRIWPSPERFWRQYDIWIPSWFEANGPVINAILTLVSVAQSSPSSPPSPPLRLVQHDSAARRGRAHLWDLVVPAYVLFQGEWGLCVGSALPLLTCVCG